ncbi:MAG: GntR family transcriptional regulator [Pseudomonadota bacterium]
MASSRNKKTNFYEDLKKRILTLDLQPGSDLDEVALSREYEISRTPLRDVLRILAGEGYLEIRSNRGAKVASMDQKTLRDFFHVAPMIYAAVSRLAAQHRTENQLDLLQSVQQRFRRAIEEDNLEDKVFYNDEFHSIIGDMANNPFLKPSLRRLLIDHARISRTFYKPTNETMRRAVERAVEHHDLMIEAFRHQDEEKSASLAIEHWQLSRQQIEAFIMPSSLDIPLGT